MLITTSEDLESKVGGRYPLVMLVAKRAQQLRDGAPVMVRTTSTNPISIALQEIKEGKLRIEVKEKPAEAVVIEKKPERLAPPIPITVDSSEIEEEVKQLEAESEPEEEEEPEESNHINLMADDTADSSDDETHSDDTDSSDSDDDLN